MDEVSVGWDWYSATVEEDWADAAHKIARATNSEPVGLGHAGRWSQFWEFQRGDTVVARMGLAAERDTEPFIEARSFADELVPIIRHHWPTHRVARQDARADFAADEWWCVLEPIFIDYSKNRGIFLEPQGAHLQPDLGGRTWYSGNRRGKSERVRRLYEKGCELKLTTRGPIRLETQWRPHSRDKASAASLTPQGLFHADHVTRHIFTTLKIDLGDVEHLARTHRPRTDIERVLDTLARQYLTSLQLMRDRFATVDELLEDLCARKARDEAVREMMRAAAENSDSEQRWLSLTGQ